MDDTTATGTKGPKLDIQKEAVCLSLSLGMVRTRRRIQTEQITTDADPTLVHVAKDIFESQELQAINQHHGGIRAYLKTRCLPSPFKTGVYLIRVKLVSEVMDAMKNFEASERELIERFMTFYERVYATRDNIESPWRVKLGSLYDARDYPAPSVLKRAFKFSTQIWEIGTPGSLRAIDRALYEREAAKMANVWEEAKQSITTVLLTEFKDLTTRMSERLEVGADGKPKVFRDSVVNNLQEWLDVFEKRNLTDDENLIGLVTQARQLISGIDPKTIRTSEGLKQEMSDAMKSLTAQIEQAIVEVPGRQIDLED